MLAGLFLIVSALVVCKKYRFTDPASQDPSENTLLSAGCPDKFTDLFTIPHPVRSIRNWIPPISSRCAG